MAIRLKQALNNQQTHKQKIKPKIKIVFDKANGTDHTSFYCLKHDFRSINTTKCYECGVAEYEKIK